MVIEILRFRLAPGVDRMAFLAADRRVQTEFAYQQPGLLRRTTAQGDAGDWIVIDLWQSEAHADACAHRWSGHPAPAAFMALLDAATVNTERYRPLP